MVDMLTGHLQLKMKGKEIIREVKTFTTSVYRKPTFCRVFTHFESFLPSTYKFGNLKLN